MIALLEERYTLGALCFKLCHQSPKSWSSNPALSGMLLKSSGRRDALCFKFFKQSLSQFVNIASTKSQQDVACG